jgi:hypothetical protein
MHQTVQLGTTSTDTQLVYVDETGLLLYTAPGSPIPSGALDNEFYWVDSKAGEVGRLYVS